MNSTVKEAVNAVDRNKLRVFLGDADKKFGLMAELEPFFQIAEGNKRFLHTGLVDPRTDGNEFWLLREPYYVITVYLADVRDKPEWMADEVYKSSLANSLDGTLDDILNQMSEKLENHLDIAVREQLRAVLRESLGAHFLDELKARFVNSFGAMLWPRVAEGIWSSLYYYLGFALADKPKKVKKLLPLVRVMPFAVPLGRKIDQQGALLILFD